MFEKLDENANKAIDLAYDEALRYHHEYVGTEHLLLGVAGKGNDSAARILKSFGIDLAWIRPAVEKLSPPGLESSTVPTDLPQTPRVKKVIECAFGEARAFNHAYVGTEHLLLGLIRVRECVAAKVLMQFGLSTEAVRQAVNDLIDHGPKIVPAPQAPAALLPTDQPTTPRRFAEAWINLAIGALLLFLMPNTPRYLLSLAHLAQPPLPMMDGTPYGQSLLVLPDAAVAAFAGVMILAGLVFLIAPRRPMLMLIGVLMAAAVLFNLVAIVVRWNQGFQIICAIAVAVGGYEIIYLLGLRGQAGKSS